MAILIGDDEQWYAEPLKDALEFKGHRVDVAKTGSEVLAKIMQARPDLLVLDVMMDPGTLEGDHAEGTRTGRVVLEKIRNELKLDRASLPVICLTVLREEALRQAMIALGADFLCKEDAQIVEILGTVQARLDGA